MHLPQLDPHEEGDKHLQALVQCLHPDDMHSFVEKLTQPQPLSERFHSYRELLVGIHFRNRGFDVRYEMEICGQTPDWSLTNSGGSPIEIVDVVTLHQQRDRDLKISAAIKRAQKWTGWVTVPPDHIVRKLDDKAGQYSKMARQNSLSYVLAVFGEFTASITPREFRRVLFDHHGGWLTTRPEISGVLYFTGKAFADFQFEYTYYPNPDAPQESVLLSECPPGSL
jgi:hypothetical protein